MFARAGLRVLNSMAHNVAQPSANATSKHAMSGWCVCTKEEARVTRLNPA
jgi:hypothetical protein